MKKLMWLEKMAGQFFASALAATVVALVLLTSACQSDLPQMDPEAHAAEIEAWQTRRVEGLKAPTGWLSVIGLDWLAPGPNAFGSDPPRTAEHLRSTWLPFSGRSSSARTSLEFGSEIRPTRPSRPFRASRYSP